MAARPAALRGRVGHLDVLALAAGLWFLAKLLRCVLPPLLPTFRGVYAASNTQLGPVFAGLMLGYAATQLPSGALADRLGTVAVVTGGAAVAAAGAALPYAAPGVPALVAAVAVAALSVTR